MPIPSCKAALSAALVVAQLSIGAIVRADQSETAGLILHDRSREAQAYATGTVTATAPRITRPFGKKTQYNALSS